MLDLIGSWVTTYQISSKSSEGPVLVALHRLDESSILREQATLQNLGYLPDIRFNIVIYLPKSTEFRSGTEPTNEAKRPYCLGP
jgi:hypothetical protein